MAAENALTHCTSLNSFTKASLNLKSALRQRLSRSLKLNIVARWLPVHFPPFLLIFIFFYCRLLITLIESGPDIMMCWQAECTQLQPEPACCKWTVSTLPFWEQSPDPVGLGERSPGAGSLSENTDKFQYLILMAAYSSWNFSTVDELSMVTSQFFSPIFLHCLRL